MTTKPIQPATPYCCGTVFERGWPRKCSTRAKVERDGKWYCGIHDPVRVAAKRAERDAEYARKCTERSAKWSMERAAPDLLAALKAVVHRTELGTALFHKLTEENAEQALAAIAKAESR